MRRLKHKKGQLKMQVLGLVHSLYTVPEVAKMMRTSKASIYSLAAQYGLVFKRASYTRTK